MQFDPIYREALFFLEELDHAVQRGAQAVIRQDSQGLFGSNTVLSGTHVPGIPKLPKANFGCFVITNIMQHLSLIYQGKIVFVGKNCPFGFPSH